MSSHPGPAALGRGVVVGAAQPAPDAWSDAPRVVVDDAALAEPGPLVRALHTAWLDRTPVVVELQVDPQRFRRPESVVVEPCELGPDHELWLDRLHFLVWANTYDARAGEPVWWWARKAARLGATLPAETGEGSAPSAPDTPDVLLADGIPAWIDGGPRRSWEADRFDGAVISSETVDAGRLTPSPPASAEERHASRLGLEPDQAAAVAHTSGSARVVAPAGSGKTRVLTERLRHLLADRRYEPDVVVAVAYNVEARDELVARTQGLHARVQTLNGLAYGLLARHRGSSPTVLDEREVRRLVDGLTPSHRHRANTDPIAPYLEALTSVRLGLRLPDEVEAERDDVPGLASLFGPYRAVLRERGVVDFDEQVYAAVEALLTDGEFRAAEQRRHRHLLVDEFQDLTPAHVLLVRLLAAPSFDVFAVGDDDQVIYEHAGADPRFLVDFGRYVPVADLDAATHLLEVNHRCPVAVVDAASRLLGRNRYRVPKQIRAAADADASPDALTIVRHRPDAGASTLAAVVGGWLDAGAAPADVAVLARVASALLAPQVALAEAGIPVRSIVGGELLDRTGTRAALAYLRLAADRTSLDPADLAEVYRRPSRGLPQWIVKWFRPGMSLTALDAVADRLDDAKAGAKVTDLAADIGALADLVTGGADARRVLEAVRDDIGLGEAMAGLDASKGSEGSSQLDDLEALVQVAALHPDVATFEPWLRAALDKAGRTPGSRRGQGDEPAPAVVTLSTVHRVKGREWPDVAVVGVTAGLLPHRLTPDEEAERRVLHVAITRGRRRVAVLGDVSRPSPFLDELVTAAPPLADRPTPRERPAATATTAAAKPSRSSRATADQGELLDTAGDARLAALRAWRLERSRADAVPAYVVAHDAVLVDLARTAPGTLTALGRVKGIGPAKLERYGAEILEAISSPTAPADGDAG
jgi:DNA helicase-2/ATP-dependent DNA helicase PcrA